MTNLIELEDLKSDNEARVSSINPWASINEKSRKIVSKNPFFETLLSYRKLNRDNTQIACTKDLFLFIFFFFFFLQKLLDS